MSADDDVYVWIANPKPGTQEPYVKAVMVGTDDLGDDLGAQCIVKPVGGGPELQLRTSEVHPCNPAGHRPDNTQLLYLNEPCVISNITQRYDEQEIYTWTSRILVAVNPYEDVNLYSDDQAAELHRRGELGWLAASADGWRTLRGVDWGVYGGPVMAIKWGIALPSR